MTQQVTLRTRKTLDATCSRSSTNCAVNCALIPHAAVACISVDLLGGLRVRTGRTTIGPRELGGTKLRRVLLALILPRGAPWSKDRLFSLLSVGSSPNGA